MPTKGFPLVPRMVPEETAVQQCPTGIILHRGSK